MNDKNINLKDFEEKIGITFSDIDLLKQALTHRSFVNENPGQADGHNERLEYLGDAVLELVVSELLYKKYSDKQEGELTALRASLVNTNSLTDISKKLGVNDYLLLSHGESKDEGKARDYILANTFEALVGAIYIDGGLSHAKKFIEKFLFIKIDNIIENKLWQDAKSEFQECAQEKVSITPHYVVTDEEGPDHSKTFTISVYLDDKKIAEGRGSSKQEGEQNAAKEGLRVKGWI